LPEGGLLENGAKKEGRWPWRQPSEKRVKRKKGMTCARKSFKLPEKAAHEKGGLRTKRMGSVWKEAIRPAKTNEAWISRSNWGVY